MESRVHPACINASNPYHECSQYCFRRIAEARESAAAPAATEGVTKHEKRKREEEEAAAEGEPDSEAQPAQAAEDSKGKAEGEVVIEDDEAGLDERQKRLRRLQRQMAEARKQNEAATLAEKKRDEAPKEERGVSKQKWFEEKQKQAGKRLEFNGIDKTKLYMLETQEAAEARYKKQEKKPTPFGWDVFNQKALFNAYQKRTKNIKNTMEEYGKARDTDPEFYCDQSSLQYGKTPDVPDEYVNRMVAELEERRSKRKDFSRRRRYHEEKDIDSINDRNEHFNRKIERAFGKYTVEIKNNLERGTALPD